MTWLTTWPLHNRPQYAAHDTEQAAEAHAHELVASGTARIATYYEISPVRPNEEQSSD